MAEQEQQVPRPRWLPNSGPGPIETPPELLARLRAEREQTADESQTPQRSGS